MFFCKILKNYGIEQIQTNSANIVTNMAKITALNKFEFNYLFDRSESGLLSFESAFDCLVNSRNINITVWFSNYCKINLGVYVVGIPGNIHTSEGTDHAHPLP